MSEEKRYKVIPESQTAHCCFEFTIVDTTKPHKHYEGKFEQLCECFDRKSAELICNALNFHNGFLAYATHADEEGQKANDNG